MKKIAAVLIICFSQSSFSALPPVFQNKKDLDVMISFIKEHPKVLSTLQSIDFKRHVVYFGKDCRASFSRKARNKPAGWVGPAALLAFSSATCEIE